jgi:hypothetical protein
VIGQAFSMLHLIQRNNKFGGQCWPKPTVIRVNSSHLGTVKVLTIRTGPAKFQGKVAAMYCGKIDASGHRAMAHCARVSAITVKGHAIHNRLIRTHADPVVFKRAVADPGLTRCMGTSDDLYPPRHCS